MANSTLKYLIAGTGGVGGSIAAFLSLAGKDVTCIARGEHLAALRQRGLLLHSDLRRAYAEGKGIYRRRVSRQGRRYLCLRQRLFRRFYYGAYQACRTQGHRSHPYSECLRNRSPHPTPCSRSHGAGRLHLHRRLCIGQGRDYPDGENLPTGVWRAQRYHRSRRTAGSHTKRYARKRHQG